MGSPASVAGGWSPIPMDGVQPVAGRLAWGSSRRIESDLASRGWGLTRCGMLPCTGGAPRLSHQHPCVAGRRPGLLALHLDWALPSAGLEA